MAERDITAALARIEQRQAAYEIVAHKLLGMHEVHNEKLDAILAALTVEPGPSPTTELLRQMLDAIRAQTALLTALPEAVSQIVRDEIDRELFGEMEPEAP